MLGPNRILRARNKKRISIPFLITDFDGKFPVCISVSGNGWKCSTMFQKDEEQLDLRLISMFAPALLP